MGHRTADESDDTQNTFSFNGKTVTPNDLGPFGKIDLTVVPKSQIFMVLGWQTHPNLFIPNV
jgi:hypothetical protein